MPWKKALKDFQELEEFPGYTEIDEDIITSNTRSNDRIVIINKIASADTTSI